MPSQIKVDEIKNVAGQYKIKTNIFEGQTTAGSITVQGEGTATTNLQQGLQKAWFRIDNMSLVDSFNASSITDNQTGDATANVTNAMGNALYCVTHSPDEGAYSDGSHRVVEGIKATTARTTSYIDVVLGTQYTIIIFNCMMILILVCVGQET